MNNEKPKKYIDVTERGITETTTETKGIRIIQKHKTELTDLKGIDLIDNIKQQIETTKTKKLNGYALTYINGLDTAYSLYGIDGVISQIVYIICNIRDKPLRIKLEEIKNKLKTKGV